MSVIALQVNSKLAEFKATQNTVASLPTEPITAKLVDITRKCAKQMDKDLAGLKANFTKFTNKIKDILKS